MKDLQGRPYLTNPKPGMKVKVDGDFTCLQPWTTHYIMSNKDGELYIPCSAGQHILSGQNEEGDEGTYYIGLYEEPN